MAGGAAYAGIPAFLKVRFNTNEILTSLMLVYVAQLFNDWLVRGPWRNPEGFSFPGTITFNDWALLPELLLRRSDAVPQGWTLCAAGKCRAIADRAETADVVAMRPCRDGK